MAKIIDRKIGTEEIIKETGGRYPLYVTITNGNNTGIDSDHPEYYRFDYASPQISQVMPNISDVLSGDKGVGYFINMVLESRNIKSDLKKATVSVDGDPSKVLLRMPNGMEIKAGVANFDWSVCQILKALNVVYSIFDGSIELSDGMLRPDHGKNLPSTITKDLAIMEKVGNINIGSKEVLGSFFVNGNTINFSPTKLGSDKVNSHIILANLPSIPNLSSCSVNGILLIFGCKNLDFNSLPKSIDGTLNLAGNDLQKLGNLPDVTGDIILAGNPNLDLMSCENSPKIGGNLLISEAVLQKAAVEDKEDTESKGKLADSNEFMKKLKEKYKVGGEIKAIRDDEALKLARRSTERYEIGISEPELGNWASLAMAFTQEEFGLLGTAAVKGIYKLLTGKSMAKAKDKDTAVKSMFGADK